MLFCLLQRKYYLGADSGATSGGGAEARLITPVPQSVARIATERKALFDLTRPRVLVLRGFVTQMLDLHTMAWKRCGDLRRDRSHFAAVW
jgi:hypothetical protein